MRVVRQAIEAIREYEPDVLVGVLDFAYAPYALGDAMTWQENVLVRAIDRGRKRVHQHLVTDPMRPSCWLQRHINSSNYVDFIRNLFPAFLCNPLAVSVNVFRDRFPFNLMLLTKWLKGQPMWPDPLDHLNHRLDYISHKQINAFFDRHGYLPRLCAPRGYEDSMKPFLARHGRDRFIVTVNMRQSRLSPNPADTWRDSPLDEWYEFFWRVAQRYPNVVFVALGGFAEWERVLPLHENVIVLRLLGYGLAHELTLLHQSDLFMGTSSGFATAATFTTVPYIITNMEPRFSRFNGVPVGTPRYPFGLDNQRVSWEAETADLLMDLFEMTYHSINSKRDKRKKGKSERRCAAAAAAE